ncbi:hypothetical protein JCM10213_007659 [Rhodosporidiobolus nylandii]
MLDRLPVELIQHIVHLTLPSPSHATYRERQDMLLALCRLSRAIRTVAQQALFEVVELASREQFDSFLEAVKRKALGARVRSVHLDGEDAGRGNFDLAKKNDLALLASSCPRLVELKTHRLFLDFVHLAPLKAVQRLIVSHCTLSCSEGVVLTSLVELSLMCVKVQLGVLDASIYPNLAALHVQLATDFTSSPSFVGDLLPRLRYLSIDGTDYLELDPSQSAAPSFLDSRCLVDFSPASLAVHGNFLDPASASAVQARINPFANRPTVTPDPYSYYSTQAIAVQAQLDSLEVLLNDNILSRLKLLIFPSDFRDVAAGDPAVDAVLRRTLALCESRGIEMVFEPTPHPYYDSLISPEFWRMCKALKTKEEEQAEGARRG